MQVHYSANMKPSRKIVLLAVAAFVLFTIDFVSADEEGTTESPEETIASTTEPGL